MASSWLKPVISRKCSFYLRPRPQGHRKEIVVLVVVVVVVILLCLAYRWMNEVFLLLKIAPKRVFEKQMFFKKILFLDSLVFPKNEEMLLKKIVFFALCLLGLSYKLESKVLVISHHYQQPFFIGLQARTFQKFSKDAYELVIFNDAKTKDLERKNYQ